MNHQIARITFMDRSKLRRLSLPIPAKRLRLWTLTEWSILTMTLTPTPLGLVARVERR